MSRLVDAPGTSRAHLPTYFGAADPQNEVSLRELCLKRQLRNVPICTSIWLWVKHGYPQWNPGKWNKGLKPAVPWCLILTHTPQYIKIYTYGIRVHVPDVLFQRNGASTIRCWWADPHVPFSNLGTRLASAAKRGLRPAKGCRLLREKVMENRQGKPFSFNRDRVPVRFHVAMGQNPNRTPGEHPNPTTKILFLQWVVNSPTNQNGIPKRF